VGYVYAEVNPSLRYLEESPQLDLVFDIREGDRYRVGRISPQITGDYPHTKITTVLNRISLVPGDIVDIRELRASERRLQRCGLFEVNAAAGVMPEIAFSPSRPNEVEAEIARRKGLRPRVRGQSPDPSWHRADRPFSDVQRPAATRSSSPGCQSPGRPARSYLPMIQRRDGGGR